MYKELIIKITLMSIHLFAILISAFIILFIDNIKILLLLLFIEIVVFINIINNGCLLSKYEHIGGDFTNITIGKKIFFIDEDIQDSTFEKIFVGVPLGFLLFKIVYKSPSKIFNLEKYINLIENIV